MHRLHFELNTSKDAKRFEKIKSGKRVKSSALECKNISAQFQLKTAEFHEGNLIRAQIPSL
jgi:hypothetical protein